MGKSYYHHVVWQFFADFLGRLIPIVLLADGKPGFIVNQWIYYLVEEGISESRLEEYLRAITHLYDFYLARSVAKGDAKPEYLLRDFIAAKKFGTDEFCCGTGKSLEWLRELNLNWHPLLRSLNTIERYLRAINEFDQWQATYHGAKLMNPFEQRMMSEFEQYRDFQQREGWDMFLHLYPARSHEKKEFQFTVRGKFEHARLSKRLAGYPKAMPIKVFIELVERSPNPRDKMLWLLMGGASLRRSECLHLLYTDIEFNVRNGLYEVLLADSERGMIRYEDSEGKTIDSTREEFFFDKYPVPNELGIIQPRSKYGKRYSKLHVGFKGVTMGDTDIVRRMLSTGDDRSYDVNYLFWISPVVQNYFRICYEEYVEFYFSKNFRTHMLHSPEWPYHPWLFINISSGNYGYPMTVEGLKKTWKRAIKRIGMHTSGLKGPHSLRHMYGYYLANVLEKPLEFAQICMHHASPESTKTYYRFGAEYVQKELTRAAIERAGFNPDFYFPPKMIRPQFPSHWAEGMQQIFIK